MERQLLQRNRQRELKYIGGGFPGGKPSAGFWEGTRMLDLQMFDTTYTVTVKKDAGITTATASAASGAKDTEITLTITPATGYEIDEIEVVEGGVTVNQETKKFTIGEANVLVFVKSKKNNLYKVLEPCTIIVNDAKVSYNPNVILEITKSGGISGVTCEGTEITMNDAVQNLIDQGILVKI